MAVISRGELTFIGDTAAERMGITPPNAGSLFLALDTKASYVWDGSAWQAIGGVTDTRTLNTTAPLTGGGDLSADRTLAISAATSASAGSMSATDKSKLDGIAAGATNTPLSTATPAAVGTAAAGTSGSAAKGDHVHNDPIWLDINRYGFVPSETTLAFDGTNTVTLAPVGTTWDYYRTGVKYTITGSKTVGLAVSAPATKGLYYIYIDSTNGALSVSTVGWTLEDTKVPVCTVAWDNALTPKYWLSDERHSCLIDRRYHWAEHFTEGTQIMVWPSLSGPNVTGGTPAAADNTLAISEGTIADEDLKHVLALLTNTNTTDLKYVVFYRSGLGNWLWVKSARPFISGTARIRYDASGTMTDATDNWFVNYYLLLTNAYEGTDSSARFSFIPGQTQYQTLASAQAETFSSLVKTGLPINEYVAVFQLTWKCHTYSGGEHGRLEALPVRVQVSASGSSTLASFDHEGLTGLQGGTTGEHYHLTAGANTGDFIRFNAVSGLWEVAAEPIALKELLLTPAAAPLLDAEGAMYYNSTAKAVMVCANI